MRDFVNGGAIENIYKHSSLINYINLNKK